MCQPQPITVLRGNLKRAKPPEGAEWSLPEGLRPLRDCLALKVSCTSTVSISVAVTWEAGQLAINDSCLDTS